MFRNRYLVLPVLLFTVTAAVQSATIHVDAANCPGPGDGSVGDPYCSIQTAIDAAVDTDEILVIAGTYFEDIDFLGKAITVLGVIGPMFTTISGTGPVVSFVGLEGSDSVLDGFTITGGNAVEGGGVLLDFSDPTVTNCIITGNSASRGAGVFMVGSTATFSSCTFSNNNATDAGGGVYCNASSPQFISCSFESNDVTGGLGDGGAMYNTNFSNLS